MVMTLYKIDASGPVRAVYMTIQALNLTDVEYVTVNLLEGEHLKEEFLQINPQHSVPTLKDDDFVVWDSHAIAAYLVNKYSEDDSLYPTDPKKRALIDQKLHFDSGILFPALRTIVVPILFCGEKVICPEGLSKIEDAYNLLEKFLDSDWLVGDEVTLADICCIATVSTLNVVLPVDQDLYPKMAAWFQRCSEQDFYIKGNAPGLAQFTGLIKSKLA